MRKGFSSVIVFVAMVIVVVGGFLLTTQNTKDLPSTQEFETLIVEEDDVSYTGTVLEKDTSCYHDGICKVRVGEYWIITDLGGDPNKEMIAQRGSRGKMFLSDGTLTGNLGGDEIVGKKAKVFAKKISDNELTLYGSGEYYIKLLSE